MITKSRNLEAFIRRHWREIIKGGVFFVDAYNNAINRKTITTITTRFDGCNHYFVNDDRQRTEADTN